MAQLKALEKKHGGDALALRRSIEQQNQGGLVDTFENGLLNLWLRNTALANVGDASGLQPSATAGSAFFSLPTAWPGESAAQNTSETTFTGYSRGSAARSSGGFNAASGGTISLAAAVSCGIKGDNAGDPLTLPFWIMGASSTGVGTAWAWGLFGNSTFGVRSFVANDTAADTFFVPGHGLAANDRVAFFGIESGGSLPTGVTEGTVYFVIATGLTTDAFKVSTTSGGSALDVTALGSGICAKIEPIILNQNTEARLGASTLIRLS